MCCAIPFQYGDTLIPGACGIIEECRRRVGGVWGVVRGLLTNVFGPFKSAFRQKRADPLRTCRF